MRPVVSVQRKRRQSAIAANFRSDPLTDLADRFRSRQQGNIRVAVSIDQARSKHFSAAVYNGILFVMRDIAADIGNAVICGQQFPRKRRSTGAVSDQNIGETYFHGTENIPGDPENAKGKTEKLKNFYKNMLAKNCFLCMIYFGASLRKRKKRGDT